MSAYFIGVDVGSASVRAGLYNANGKRLGFSSQPIMQFHPCTDFVEQSSENIWTQLCQTVRQAVQKAGVAIKDIKGIGFDATCSLVALDKDYRPSSISPTGQTAQNIIMWMDHRAIHQADQINKSDNDALRYVGGEISPEMQLPKILWLKEQLNQQYQQIAYFFDLADFLVFKASGNPVRSVCTCSCKWNYLSHEKRWATSLLESVQLTELLEGHYLNGTIQNVGTSAGTLTDAAAKELGLTMSTTVATGIIDAHAGGLAIIGTQPDTTLAIIGGTSSCHMALTRDACYVPGIWGPYWGAMMPDYWLLEGGQSAAGALIDHVIEDSAIYPQLKTQAKVEHKTVYELLNKTVLELETTNPCLTQDFHLLGYHHGNRSPRADATLKGMMSGLTLSRDIRTLAIHYLAAIQSVAYGTRHIIETMRSNGLNIQQITMCGGGCKNPLWLREHADITGCNVILNQEQEAVLLGSAILAATASQHYESIPSASEAMSHVGQTIIPRSNFSDFHNKKYNVFLEMYADQMKYRQMVNNE